MEISNQQYKKLCHSNFIASDIRKEFFGTEHLNNWENDTENTEYHNNSNHTNIYEDRFQVDRTKLRMMMQISNTIPNKTEADVYFENIMKSTQTHIEWPRSYKSDTKCKQHPYVRVCGSQQEDVAWAKGLVLANLEVNNSFPKLKMAISNVDHLYILGRNNNNINRIMDNTKTHVQFPDSNQMKKENQVIVYGTLNGLENARVLLRSSSPLLMSFELAMNQTIPFVERVGAYFKVQVVLAASSKPHISLVLIRGSVKKADKIKEATRSLLNTAFGKFASSTIVSAQLEIPPHHQESVKGEDCANILAIMEQTNTKIFFPELPSRGYKKSQVIITGTIEEVCVARKKLVDSFPIELIFDIPDENRSATEIMNLGKEAGLSITISQKERKCGTSVTIKGAERFMDKIYEVHRKILKLKLICVPKSLFMGKDTHKSEMEERSYLEMEDRLNERSISNEQFPAMSSPDSGYVSQASHRGGSQQNQWTIFDQQNPQHTTNLEPSDLIEHQFISSPNINYHHSNTLIQTCIPSDHHRLNMVDYNTPQQPQFVYPGYSNYETNDWNIYRHHNTEAMHHISIQQIQEYADISPHTHPHKQLGHSVEPEEICPSYQNLQYSGLNNYLNGIEYEPSASSSLKNSPLIVGSEESVAEKLICIGWGNFF